MNTILIADREPAHRQQIRRHIDSRPGFRVIGECGNCHETIRSVNALEPDVLFLDVQLGGEHAFDLIRQTDHLPKVIYTAQSESYALQAFDHQALDYLLKPYGAARLDAALRKAATLAVANDVPDRTLPLLPRHRHLFVEDGGRLRRVALSNIRYLKAAGDYTVVYTEQGEFLSSSGIGSVERRLDAAQFLRVHRSFIVNVERIDACYRDIGRLYLVMENGQEIGVGKHYLNSIKSLIL
ncbi:DNA-binding response regulator [Parapedobacter defluvii]|uniref:DNA-binding response regulator n=1 Tax=Parapedobacter defluvii TaxID=2045106 RepID=A0ABQ1LXT7_9SPHI|nr:LytTR family DNA-binding domain-containing protein [Parapedobacter defluvii]GGC30408.1 DNA-binding response regulator [Parapedobacter defluvii]